MSARDSQMVKNRRKKQISDIDVATVNKFADQCSCQCLCVYVTTRLSLWRGLGRASAMLDASGIRESTCTLLRKVRLMRRPFLVEYSCVFVVVA